MSDATIKEMIDFEYGITESTPVQKSLFFGQLKLKTYPANTLLLGPLHLGYLHKLGGFPILDKVSHL